MSDASLTTNPASPPDPGNHPGGHALPQRIGEILAVVRILLDYGRHLAATLERRAAARGFSTIAQFFGTAKVSVIMAHLQRGIMRAVALERVLLERAARGRDLAFTEPPKVWFDAHAMLQAEAEQAADMEPPAAPPAEPKPAAPAVARRQAAPQAWRPDPNQPLTFAHIPTMEDIEAEVRRRPFGRTIADICADFGIAPTLCSVPFWDSLFMIFRCYRGSFNKLLAEMRSREKRFEARELDSNPKLGWPAQTRDEVRRMVGFFIGEPTEDPSAEPLAPGTRFAAATATGPP